MNMFSNYSYIEDDEFAPRPINRILITVTHYDVIGSEVNEFLGASCRVPIVYAMIFPDKKDKKANTCMSKKVQRTVESFQAYMNASKSFTMPNALCANDSEAMDMLIKNVEISLKEHKSEQLHTQCNGF